MRTYLLVYSEEFNSVDVREWVDNHPRIYDWVECLPYAYFLVSDRPAHILALSLTRNVGDHRYIIIDTKSMNKQGLLPRQVWKMMRKPGPRDQLQLPFAKKEDDEDHEPE